MATKNLYLQPQELSSVSGAAKVKLACEAYFSVSL